MAGNKSAGVLMVISIPANYAIHCNEIIHTHALGIFTGKRGYNIACKEDFKYVKPKGINYYIAACMLLTRLFAGKQLIVLFLTV